MKYSLILILMLISNLPSFTQQKTILEGKVSYISPQLVYLKFEDTEGINAGDTLFQYVNKKYQPRLVVKFLSSVSVSCEKIYEFDLRIGDSFYAFVIRKQIDKVVTDKSSPTNNSDSVFLRTIGQEFKVEGLNQSLKIKTAGNIISGKYSLQSYSNIDNYSRNDYQSWRHTLRIDYERIGNSELDFSTYSIFNYRPSEWELISKNYFNALKVYDFHLKYNFNNSFEIWMGRFLNPKISNISTVDGLLLEVKLSSFAIGIVGGSRPDWKDFTFNPKLFEYGIYLSRQDNFSNNFLESTISFFQQTNNFKTDRRYLYLQHSNNLITKINLFASSEIDLYKRESGVDKNQISFTSIFLSASYNPMRELSFNLSYDARKNVIYYETFKSLTDSIIESETRQGFRIRANIKPFKYFGASVFAGYRYRKTDFKPSRNFGGSVYYSLLPFLETGLNISFNKLISAYVDGDVYSLYMTKSFNDFNSDLSIGFRKTKYKFPISNNSFNENALLIDYNLNLFRLISIIISYEGAFESSRTNNRFLIGITTRF